MSDIEVFEHLVPTKEEEALMTFEYGLSPGGHGAKVYGFFQAEDGTFGRIDEFIDARTLEPEDVEDAGIRGDIARGMARFHTMEVSLGKKEAEGQGFHEALTHGLRSHRGVDKLKEIGRRGGVNIDNLIDYDFASRVENVVQKLESLNAKKGWCIHDVQYRNVLVRNDPKPTESQTVLVDFEFAMRNYRGFDIGGHFMQKMFKWYDEESKVVGCREYGEEERRHFCEEYAREWDERTGDEDTGEQVFMEAQHGYLLAVALDVHNMLCAMGEESDEDPLSLVGLNKLFSEFMEHYAEVEIDLIKIQEDNRDWVSLSVAS